jgi:hypothetical protein
MGEIGVKIMGEILELASWVATPLGAVCAIAFVASLFFMGGGSSQNPRGNKIAEIMETKSLFLMSDL